MIRITTFVLLLVCGEVSQSAADIVFGKGFDGGSSDSVSTYTAAKNEVAVGIKASQTFAKVHGYTPVTTTSSQLQVSGLGCVEDLGGGTNNLVVPKFFAAPSFFSDPSGSPSKRTDDYFEFQIGLDAASSINFDSFEYSSLIVSGDGGLNLAELHVKLPDEGLLHIANFAIPSTTATSQSVDLSGFSQLQNVRSDLQFHLFVQQTECTAADVTPNNVVFALNSFAFNGSVTAVPEPSSAAILVLGVPLALFRRRSRRASV